MIDTPEPLWVHLERFSYETRVTVQRPGGPSVAHAVRVVPHRERFVTPTLAELREAVRHAAERVIAQEAEWVQRPRRRGGPCDHRKCQGDPKGCRMYRAEDVDPDEEAYAFARRLLAEGWVSVSTKYRHMRRWKSPPPRAHDILTDEALASSWGSMAMEALRRCFGTETELRQEPSGSPLIEECEISIKQHAAYRAVRREKYGW